MSENADSTQQKTNCLLDMINSVLVHIQVEQLN